MEENSVGAAIGSLGFAECQSVTDIRQAFRQSYREVRTGTRALFTLSKNSAESSAHSTAVMPTPLYAHPSSLYALVMPRNVLFDL